MLSKYCKTWMIIIWSRSTFGPPLCSKPCPPVSVGPLFKILGYPFMLGTVDYCCNCRWEGGWPLRWPVPGWAFPGGRAMAWRPGSRWYIRILDARFQIKDLESQLLELIVTPLLKVYFKTNQNLYHGSSCPGVGGEQGAGDVAQLHHKPRSPQVHIT